MIFSFHTRVCSIQRDCILIVIIHLHVYNNFFYYDILVYDLFCGHIVDRLTYLPSCYWKSCHAFFIHKFLHCGFDLINAQL